MYNSALFIVYFLPVVVIGHFVLPACARNAWLLAASLVFYGWTQPLALPVLVVFICANYALGRWVEKAGAAASRARWLLIIGLAANLALLFGLKVCAAYLVPSLLAGNVLGQTGAPVVSTLLLAFLRETGGLPLGFSFLVVHTVAYLVDIYKKRTASAPRGAGFALYLALFPKVTAGPIVLYRDISKQIAARVTSSTDVARGARRFIVGLGKKVLVADMIGPAADWVFGFSANDLSTGLAWRRCWGFNFLKISTIRMLLAASLISGGGGI
jgi:alginate O-acetyltransferase complex protein AlgI